MRNMSFALTTEQYRNGTKTVTRRMNWETLTKGDEFMGVEKGMGLKKGEKMKRLGPAAVVSVRREPLRRMIDEPERQGQAGAQHAGKPQLEFLIPDFLRSEIENSLQLLAYK